MKIGDVYRRGQKFIRITEVPGKDVLYGQTRNGEKGRYTVMSRPVSLTGYRLVEAK